MSLLQVPSAVVAGYAGEDRLPVQPPAYFLQQSVYGSPSIMKASAVESPDKAAMFWPPTDAPTRNEYLHPVRRSEAPDVPMRGSSSAKTYKRVAFQGPQYFYSVQAPTLDAVQAFMATRQKA